MPEPAHPSGDRPAYTLPVPPRRRPRLLRGLLLVALLAAAGYGLWLGGRWALDTFQAVTTQQELLARLARDLAALRAQADELAARQTDLSQAVRRNGGDIATLGGRLEDSEQALGRLSDTIEGGRTRIHLAAIEQLLLLANDRLRLARDVTSALQALDLADQRLALLNDPRFYNVREALARERSSLAQLALPDTAGIGVTLADMLRRAPDLPLRTRVPERFETEAREEYPHPEAPWTTRVWTAVKTALTQIFALRRADGPKPRLLAADEEALVRQMLALKLESARLALLAADGRAFSDLVGGARAWLRDYYDERDPAVRVMAAELERLHALNLSPEPPDISRSLALLRGHLGASPR